jgi:hypothetical protein
MDMKKNMFVLVAALLVGNSVFAEMHPTMVKNNSSHDIRVVGAAGTHWSIKRGETRKFESGVRDNFSVQLGMYDPKANRVVSRQEDRTYVFDLSSLKGHFAWVKNVVFNGNGTLTIHGALRVHSSDPAGKDGDMYYKFLKSRCEQYQSCQVEPRAQGSIQATVTGIKARPAQPQG